MKHLTLLLLAALSFSAHAAADMDSLALLNAGNHSQLDRNLNALQRDFESGKASEIDLRDAYRPFYDVEGESVKNLEQWVARMPASYPAHLAKGIWYKRRALDMRGTDYVQKTPPEMLKAASELHTIAQTELEASLKLAAKPYLSVFHLMGISLVEGSHKDSEALLDTGNRMLPTNTLLRDRYIVTLEPRWGGSYDAMARFIMQTKAQGAPAESVRQLEAIMHDDAGHAFMERGQKEAAVPHLRQALELATQARGGFREEFLGSANYYSCRVQELKQYCDR
jgi:hypothetical protein